MSATHSSPTHLSSAEAGGARTRLAWSLLSPWPHGQLVCAAIRRDDLRASSRRWSGETLGERTGQRGDVPLLGQRKD